MITSSPFLKCNDLMIAFNPVVALTTGTKLFTLQLIFLDSASLTFVILGPKSLNWSKNLTGWFSNFFCHD